MITKRWCLFLLLLGTKIDLIKPKNWQKTTIKISIGTTYIVSIDQLQHPLYQIGTMEICRKTIISKFRNQVRTDGSKRFEEKADEIQTMEKGDVQMLNRRL